VITTEPAPNFCAVAAAALDKAGINPNNRHRAARDTAANAANRAPAGSTLVEAKDDKIVYKITIDLPDAGLGAQGILAVVQSISLLDIYYKNSMV
jgi:hypothetical protein